VRWHLIALFSVPVAATLISLAFYGPRALAAPSGGWPRALAEVAAFFCCNWCSSNLPRRLDSPGSSSITGQDRYNPMKLTLSVALLWAVWHMPDHFAEEGWDLNSSSRHLSFRHRVRLAVLRPRLVRVVLQPHR
jgi:hypothetical protein